MTHPQNVQRRTRKECIAGAAAAFNEARRRRDSMTVTDAARAAHTAGGPTLAELEDQIRALRSPKQVAA